ncbi:hypothetical protein [Meridianimarinicoccus marinus]
MPLVVVGGQIPRHVVHGAKVYCMVDFSVPEEDAPFAVFHRH